MQFGLDRRAEVSVTEPWQESLLARLATGIRSEAFDVVAHSVGAPRMRARRFLEEVRPVLRTARATPPRVHVSRAESAPVGTQLWLREALRDAGIVLSDAADRHSVAMVAVAGAASARAFADLLATDRAHLPVAFDAGGATIGPLVVPGRTPCLSCRDAQQTETDPAWPLLHAQLVESDPGEISAARIVAAGLVATELLTALRPGGAWVRLSAAGVRRWYRLRLHAECHCHRVPLRSPPGSAIRKPTTTQTETAPPA